MAKKRERAVVAETSYFTGPKSGIQFVPSGCTPLDCDLGGGWALGRMANVMGDTSTSKTGLAMEALINFVKHYPDGKAAYRDVEAAFEEGYAQAMGLPLEQIDFGDPENPLITVEDFQRDIQGYLATLKKGQPGIYILDSLDALSDEAEMEREIGKGTFGAAKAKAMSEFFRKTARKVEQTQVLLLIISQIRDNVGVMFGEKFKRSGGKAVGFYASQILQLSGGKSIDRKVKGISRSIGISVRYKVKKNKVGLPFREGNFDYEFGYGVNDLFACVDWLDENKRLMEHQINDTKAYLERCAKMSDADYKSELLAISETVKRVWPEVEQTFIPTRRKYD